MPLRLLFGPCRYAQRLGWVWLNRAIPASWGQDIVGAASPCDSGKSLFKEGLGLHYCHGVSDGGLALTLVFLLLVNSVERCRVRHQGWPHHFICQTEQGQNSDQVGAGRLGRQQEGGAWSTDPETYPERKPGHQGVGGCRQFQVALGPREAERPSRSRARWGLEGPHDPASQCLAPLGSSEGSLPVLWHPLL